MQDDRQPREAGQMNAMLELLVNPFGDTSNGKDPEQEQLFDTVDVSMEEIHQELEHLSHVRTLVDLLRYVPTLTPGEINQYIRYVITRGKYISHFNKIFALTALVQKSFNALRLYSSGRYINPLETNSLVSSSVKNLQSLTSVLFIWI